MPKVLQKASHIKGMSKKFVKLLELLEEGMSLKEACELAEVSYRRVEHWKKEKSYRWDLIRRAQLLFKRELIASLKKASDKGRINAAMWLLERKYKQEFALRTELTGAQGKDLPPVVIYDKKDPLLKQLVSIPDITKPVSKKDV